MKKTRKIAIVDYGLGNLYSISKAVKLFTDDVIITDDPVIISSSDAIIIPGVGAFAVGMEGLKKRNLVEPLRKFAISGKPMLGICLGAQLMLSKGFEFGEHDGLGIVSGKVEIFTESVSCTKKIPHIGWNGIYVPKMLEWKGTIFEDIKENANVYFVHSYIMIPDNIENVGVFAEYGGLEFCAAIKKGNVYGTQFHPEKSGEIGLKIIKNFISLI